MKKNKLNKLLHQLIRIRETELEIAKQYKKQKMRCPVHLSIGQESVPVAICQNLNKKDQIVTAHRSHAHYLAKGGNLKKMISELHGKITGCASGKGGSMHLIDTKANVIAAVPIVGSTIPIGVGAAWANKLKNNINIVVVFFGDGATEQGVFYESLNFASLHKLRVLFVCENNRYSVYSNIKKRQATQNQIRNLARSFGIETHYLKNHDLFNIFERSKKIIFKMRKKSLPIFFEIETYRQIEHCGPENDDELNYRNQNEINFWKKNCQVKLNRDLFLKKRIISEKNLQLLEKKIKKEILEAFNYAIKSKFPNKNDVNKNIFKKNL